MPHGQILNACNSLFNLDLLILFLLTLSWEPLPREPAPNEVHQHDANLLQVVPPCLFNTQVGIETRIPCRTRERLAIFERNVSARLWVFVTLSQAEVYEVENVLVLARTYEEVVGFDVSVEEAIGVNVFNALELKGDVMQNLNYHLDCKH